ncbi:MAG: hypothetical protein GY796_29700 [Chloroflexi bacterium]|nr:hypothetical protein [Chloroflexota bacterium]
MKTRIMKLILTAVTLFLLGQIAPLKAQQNLLQNPSFEQPYGSKGEANGWDRWHHNSSEDQFNDCTNGYHKLPNWSAESNSSLIKDGSASQHIGNQWDTWKAGVFQNVSVTAGSTYRFTVWSYAFGSNSNFPGPSDGSLNSKVRVGIDPDGSGVWNDGDVVWSGKINPLDNWQQVSLEVTAAGSQISVFTSANWGVKGVNQCRAHLDIWFDAAELIEVGPPPTNTPPPAPTQPPPPPVTNTPVPPTLTPTSEVPPTETPIPTETPVPTNTPSPGGTICVNAFNDANGNGIHDEGEGPIGNVTFTIATATELVGQAVSTGTSDPVCFAELPAAQYTVSQIVPGALEMTTAPSTNIGLQESQVVGIEFGSRLHSDVVSPNATEVADIANPAATATAETPTDEASAGGGMNLLALGGLLLLIGAIVLLGALVFLVLRQQRA